MDKVNILDGNNFFSRVFFDGGRELSCVVTAFIKLRQRYKGRFLVTFDTSKSERRLAMYPEYKAGRKSSLSPEEYEVFKSTMGAFMRVVKNMKVSVLEGDGYEADDYIAMVTAMLKRFHVHIHSTDKDFWQLVSNRVTIIRPTNKFNKVDPLTPENFVEVVGVPQEFFLDYKCMIGDKSDNIPGIDGVGPGRAAKYINEFGCYADILEALKPKLAETKKSKQPNGTEMKILNGPAAMKLAKDLMDLSVVYRDARLKNLVSEKVKNTVYSAENILEILTDFDSEECFDVVRAQCKNLK